MLKTIEETTDAELVNLFEPILHNSNRYVFINTFPDIKDRYKIHDSWSTLSTFKYSKMKENYIKEHGEENYNDVRKTLYDFGKNKIIQGTRESEESPEIGFKRGGQRQKSIRRKSIRRKRRR